MKTCRRDFFKGMTIVAATAGVPSLARAGAATTHAGGSVRFCAFADLHYYPGVLPNSENLSFLDGVLARAKAEKAEFIIDLGDFVHRTDRPEELAAIKRYRTCGLPNYHVLGNHDGEYTSVKEAMELFGMKKNYYFFDCKGWRFIVGDDNHFKTKDGKFVHYERWNFDKYVKANNLEWFDCIPPEQVKWLRQTIDASPYPCVFFSHGSVERGWSVRNNEEIRAVFNEANRKSPGKVRLVINGHHHTDHVCVLDDIVYLELNSANYYYFGKQHDAYPPEMRKKAEDIRNTIAWREPLSAVISLDEENIRIDGSHSTYLLDITPEKAGYPPFDELRRPALPLVSTFEYKRTRT